MRANISSTLPSTGPHFIDHNAHQIEIPFHAMSLVGLPYRWGGDAPDSGFDCSGLVRYVVQRAARITLPRTSADMSDAGVAIAPEQIAPGDLVFFNINGKAYSHVGIYVGNMRFVNAPSRGGTVRLDSLASAYWRQRFSGIRRITHNSNDI